MFQRPHSRFSYEGKQRMVGWIFPLPLFRLLTQAPLLASVQTPARLHQIKHKEDVLFTPLAYTSVPRSFFSSAFCVFFSVDNAPLFPWTWELWEFQSASRRPRRFSSNRISAEATLRPPPKWRWTNQIEVSCQENDAHPSMIDAHRWKWQVMDTLVFNNTTSCVNLTLKMHACTYIYTQEGEATSTSRTLTRLQSYIWLQGLTRVDIPSTPVAPAWAFISSSGSFYFTALTVLSVIGALTFKPRQSEMKTHTKHCYWSKWLTI